MAHVSTADSRSSRKGMRRDGSEASRGAVPSESGARPAAARGALFRTSVSESSAAPAVRLHHHTQYTALHAAVADGRDSDLQRLIDVVGDVWDPNAPVRPGEGAETLVNMSTGEALTTPLCIAAESGHAGACHGVFVLLCGNGVHWQGLSKCY